MKKSLLIITLSILMLHKLAAQAKHGVENYNVLQAGTRNVWIPVIHYKAKNNLYAEARYNYEELNTASVYGGRTFNGGKKLEYNITPMLGLVFGEFNGTSAAVNTSLDYKKLNFCSQLQYTMSNQSNTGNFFYNWAEISHSFLKNFYAGVSLQQTLTYKSKIVNEAGLLIGFSAGKITIPVYMFNPLKSNRNIMLGIIAEWE